MTAPAPLRAPLLLALTLALMRPGLAGQSTYVGQDASRCEIARALSALVPADCRPAFQDKTPVIRPVAPPRPTAPGPSPASLPLPRVTPGAERAMATPIAFAFDSDRLTPDARRQLDTIAGVLQDPLFRALAIRIEGHTDTTGPAPYNLTLSRRRALSVRDYLVTRHAIEPQRLAADGKGETDPFDTRNPESAVNRRVEFVNTGLAP